MVPDKDRAGDSSILREGELTGKVTCPKCGHVQEMPIPVNACQAFYECGNCKKRVTAEKTCCVFCEYGDKKCPAGQHA